MSYEMEDNNLFDLSRLLSNKYDETEKEIKIKDKFKKQSLGLNEVKDSFNLNLISLNTEMKNKSFFFPMEKNNENIYFGAFVNTSQDLKIERLGLPILSNKNEDFQQVEEEFNKYLQNYEEVKIPSCNMPDRSISLERKNCQPILFEMTDKYFNKMKVFPNQLKIPENYIFDNGIIINPFNMINYDVKLQENYNNLIYTLDLPLDPTKFNPSLIYLIQGIPSEYFVLNLQTLRFKLTSNNFRFITCLPELTKNFLEFFMDFGTKIFLINLLNEHYLYLQNTPYVLKIFFSDLNLIIMKINEKILNLKESFLSNKLHVIGLMKEIQSFSNLINLIYYILNLPYAVDKYLNFNEDNKNIKNFILIYEENQIYLKPHSLIDSLFEFLNSFFHVKTVSYKFIKNSLLQILKSYLKYIVILIFKNEIIDFNNEYFFVKNNNVIEFESNKVPKFLKNYINVILNLSKLLNYISKYEYNYYEVSFTHIDLLLLNIENYNFEEQTHSDYESEVKRLESFISLKDKIYEIKYKMMFIVNDKVLEENKIKETEEHLKKLNHLKILKSFMSLSDEYNKQIKQIELDKKKTYLLNLQNQIIQKKLKIDEELRRIKEENVEIRRKKEIEKEVEKLIINNLRQKYQEIVDKTKDSTITDNKLKLWKLKRRENDNKRFTIFNEMFDVEKISDFYSNDHSKIKSDHNNTVESLKEITLNGISESFSNIAVDNEKIDESFDYINYFRNQILFPIFDQAVEISNQRKKYEEIKFINKEKEIYSDVDHLIHKMKVIIEDSNSISTFSKIEVPIQIFIQEFFYDIIMKQYKIVNNSFTLMIKNKFHLFYHFDFINKIFLCGSSDIIDNFIESVMDYKTISLISNEEEFLFGILKNDISRKYIKANYYQDFLKYLKILKINQLKLKFSLNNVELAFQLLYILPDPLNFVFTQDTSEKYDMIFKFFFKFKAFQKIISRIFSILKNKKNVNYSNLFNKMNATLFNCFNLLKSVENFLMSEIIYKNWTNLITDIKTNLDVYYIINKHNEFLDKTISILNCEIFSIINKLQLKLTQFYIKFFSDESDFFDMERDNEISEMIDKLTFSCSYLKKIISQEKVVGDFHNLKYYI